MTKMNHPPWRRSIIMTKATSFDSSLSLHPPSPSNLSSSPDPTSHVPTTLALHSGLHKEYHQKRSVGVPGGQNVLQKIEVDKLAFERKANIFYPFADKREWELSEFLALSSLSQAEINTFLKLHYVSETVAIFIWPQR